MCLSNWKRASYIAAERTLCRPEAWPTSGALGPSWSSRWLVEIIIVAPSCESRVNWARPLSLVSQLFPPRSSLQLRQEATSMPRGVRAAAAAEEGGCLGERVQSLAPGAEKRSDGRARESGLRWERRASESKQRWLGWSALQLRLPRTKATPVCMCVCVCVCVCVCAKADGARARIYVRAHALPSACASVCKLAR